MEIKQATPQDAELLHSLVQEAFAEYRTTMVVPPSALAETLEEVRAAIETGQVFLAWDGPEAVGTVRYEVHPDYLYVGRLAVPPRYRGRGVGAALMVRLEELARDKGLPKVRLGTRQSMPGNLAFYSRLGYTVVERVPHTAGPDFWVWFEKELTPA